MTLSYYVTMGMVDDCCVAHHTSEFVTTFCSIITSCVAGISRPSFLCGILSGRYEDVAVRLGLDASYRTRVATTLRQRSHLIWERREVVLRWQLLFMTAVRWVAMRACSCRCVCSHIVCWRVCRSYPVRFRRQVREELYGCDDADHAMLAQLLEADDDAASTRAIGSVDTNVLADSGGLLAVGSRDFAPDGQTTAEEVQDCISRIQPCTHARVRVCAGVCVCCIDTALQLRVC